ncbi:glycoside hydrolase family 18 protein [Roridomyces roridus]|uniref:chitinase n=1 Tax=Roridomyces roridus TaxID=1738132 RepID=A0AAD7FLC6_9AGAR|nr:glycoside hydrolase family 18 protein [Roridomyces roridus]
MVLRFLSLAAVFLSAFAFDNSRYDNVAVYWGQNSIGAISTTPQSQWQKPLSFYCGDSAIDVFPIAFVNGFFSTGGEPTMNLANTCNPTDNATFPGTLLPNCASLAADIQTCQSKGKLVTISLGGATGGVGFASDAQATTFADTIWNLYLDHLAGGSSSTRPFGNAVLDGVDLDIEQGANTGYAAFVNEIRRLSSGASKKYYVTAAPQCVYPDSALGNALNSASFDAIYVQFYNNPWSGELRSFRGLQTYPTVSAWNFGIWDQWARTVSLNPNVKVYIGAPASSTASGAGYVDLSTLSNIAVTMRKSFPSFGGVMLWDASQAWQNNRYDLGIKNALVAAGGTGFTFPACSAAAYSTSGTYPGGSQVSYQGYIYQAKWFASSAPSLNANGDWSAISACGGTSTGPTTTTTPSTSTSTTVSTTSSAPATGPTGSGSCAGVPAWSSAAIFVGGDKATYNGDLWTAQWWTEGDIPGGAAGVWVNNGACSASKRASSRLFRN